MEEALDLSFDRLLMMMMMMMIIDLERQYYPEITKNKGEILPSGPKRPLTNFMTEENARLKPAGSTKFLLKPEMITNQIGILQKKRYRSQK